MQKLQPFSPTVPHPTCIFDSPTLDSSFLPPPLAEFTKFQNGIVVELQLHADAFASAKITSLPLLFADETTNSPTFLFAALLSVQQTYQKANTGPREEML